MAIIRPSMPFYLMMLSQWQLIAAFSTAYTFFAPASTESLKFFTCKQAEDEGAGTDIEYNLVFEECSTVKHSPTIGLSPNLVLQHFLVDINVGV